MPKPFSLLFHRLLAFLKQISPLTLLLIAGSGIVNAVGVVMFLAPVNLYDSGISGTSMFLWLITPESFTLSLFLIVLNVPLFLYGLKKQGPLFTFYSVWAVAVYSAAAYVITYVLPVNVDYISPFAGRDLLLCAIFGGLISGAGSGLTLRFGGAIDGIEVLASIFARGLGMSIGTFVMIYNAALYITAALWFKSWVLPLYSILSYYVATQSVDFIVEGLDRARAVFVITGEREKVCAALSEHFGRGITVMDAQGYYSGIRKSVVYFAINRFQIPRVKRVLKEADPAAFVTIHDVIDVMGTSLKFRGM